MKRGRYQAVSMPAIDQLRQELHRVQYRSRYCQMLKNTVGMLLVVAAVAVLAATIWLPVLRILGSSMSPTLKEGDIVLCVKDEKPEPGELVSFYIGNKLLVKRCIAGPGQKVDMDEAGNVYVDGALLEEAYVSGKSLGQCEIQLPCQVPEEQIFCLGDRRDVSVDSRREAVGFVSREQIAGKPVLRVWPLSRFGLLE